MDYKNFDETQELEYSLDLDSSISENGEGLPEKGNKKDFTNHINFDETQELQYSIDLDSSTSGGSEEETEEDIDENLPDMSVSSSLVSESEFG